GETATTHVVVGELAHADFTAERVLIADDDVQRNVPLESLRAPEEAKAVDDAEELDRVGIEGELVVEKGLRDRRVAAEPLVAGGAEVLVLRVELARVHLTRHPVRGAAE